MIFIANKYTKWYNSIISNAQARTSIAGYTEKHHIIPKSLGGTNNKNNLVTLTAKEHFICHRILTKMVSGYQQLTMLKALSGMTTINKFHQRHLISARRFAQIREQAGKAHSLMMTGKFVGTKNPMYGKKASEETKAKLRASAKLRPKPSKEVVEKRAAAIRGRVMSDEAKLKMSLAWKTKPKLQCKYCGKVCSTHMHNRWHGNNCKTKPQHQNI